MKTSAKFMTDLGKVETYLRAAFSGQGVKLLRRMIEKSERDNRYRQQFETLFAGYSTLKLRDVANGFPLDLWEEHPKLARFNEIDAIDSAFGKL
jgi:hypothetical protein